ncbi:Lipase 5 [Emydomyces testavorans]|uniref:Patatin-like phospholipase domain-containing protein n=1 Tax=Emydomyces testavorans TaxID=2070801 RepID=A0AAF0ILX9_9EURO|nr:Lipase 5 [Emydomyces testavorans]
MFLITDATVPVASCSTSSKRSRLGGLRTCISIPHLSSLVWNFFARASFIVYSFRNRLSSEEFEQLLEIERRKQELSWSLPRATTLHEWLQIAKELDELEGNNEWKSIDESDEYDHVVLRARLDDLECALDSHDLGAIVHTIRTSFSRNLANMTNPNLYKRAHIGTKNLIDLYVTTATKAVAMVLEMAGRFNVDESRFLLEQLQATRQAFGRSALLLSGGATFGMNHTGVVKTLWQMRLLPRVISGSSAGSIVASVICAHPDDKIPKILSTFGNGDFSVFESKDEVEYLVHRLKRFLRSGSLFDIAHLRRIMRDLLGDITFLEAYNRTRRILNITVSHADSHELPRLLNYITSPNVIIWSAVATSCSAPLMFSASGLMAKDPATGEILEWGESLVQWIDGSVDGDLPMARLSEMFNVNHFIVSQVNPHVIPFVPPDEAFLLAELTERQQAPETGVVHFAKRVIKEETMGVFTLLSQIGIFPNTLRKFVSIMRQDYYGDINILPEITYEVFPSVLRNPTPHFMLRACLSGERATWPKLGCIRNHCAIELTLDAAVLVMREKIAAAARNAHIPLDSMPFYIDENVHLDDITTKDPRRKPARNELHKVKGVRTRSHTNPVHQLRRSKSSLHLTEFWQGCAPHVYPIQDTETKTLPPRPSWRLATRVSDERNHLIPSESGPDGTTHLSSSTWLALASLPHQHSKKSTRSGKQTPVVLSRRGSFTQIPAFLAHPQLVIQQARRAHHRRPSVSGVTLPHIIMAVKSGPPSPGIDQGHRKILRKAHSDSAESSKRDRVASG